MTGGAHRGGYRGYEILAVWLRDHWVFRVFHRWEWVDTFSSLEEAQTTIDAWLDAP